MENAGPRSRATGSRGVENTWAGGKHGVWWKTRDVVENTEYGGKHGIWWKTRDLVENTGSGGKHGV